MADSKKIQYYGITSWASLRLPIGDKDHVDLQKVADVARKVGGEKNRFKFVQFPVILKG
jgi:hypothetical protein